MKKNYLDWWKNFGSGTKKLLQIRYFPATNWEYLRDEQIKHIHKQETLNK